MLINQNSPKIFTITGTDTDIGKTVVTAALLRALRQNGLLAQAIKIVQTGVDVSLSQENVGDCQVYGQACQDLKQHDLPPGKVMRSFRLAASPHLAAANDSKPIDLNELYLDLTNYISKTQADVFLLETAGGLFVPLNGQKDMLDLLKRLGCEVILCAQNKLGAINQALSASSAINAAGLKLTALILTEPHQPTNDPVEKIISLDNLDLLAKRLDDNPWPGSKDKKPFSIKLPYLNLPTVRGWDEAAHILEPLVKRIIFKPLPKQSLIDLDQSLLWHPYTKANQPGPLYPVKTAFENKIILEDGRQLIDGMSSWWSAIHGYNHPKLVAAIQNQAAKLCHIMFGGFTHEPAINLGLRLIEHLPRGLAKIFFADSGSVAVEVAMKMALQYHQGLNQKERCHFLTPYGGYHGDTLGAMSVCDPINGMHQLFKDYLPKQFFMPRPNARFDQPFDPDSLNWAREILASHGSKIAAVIIEPIVQGAGGMWFYHPEYLKGLAKLAKEAGCLIIFDEIATGFGHTGRFFASEWADLCPDILCIGKGLTGGMLTLAATACREDVAVAISAQNQVFMHGPTFMANPLACAAALASLDIMDEMRWPTQVTNIAATMKDNLAPCAKLSSVADVRVLGDIGVVETKVNVKTDFLVPYFVNHGVWIRPFNNLVYIMPPYISSTEDITFLCTTIYNALVDHEKYI